MEHDEPLDGILVCAVPRWQVLPEPVAGSARVHTTARAAGWLMFMPSSGCSACGYIGPEHPNLCAQPVVAGGGSTCRPVRIVSLIAWPTSFQKPRSLPRVASRLSPAPPLAHPRTIARSLQATAGGLSPSGCDVAPATRRPTRAARPTISVTTASAEPIGGGALTAFPPTLDEQATGQAHPRPAPHAWHAQRPPVPWRALLPRQDPVLR
jgi:hypothetical protein